MNLNLKIEGLDELKRDAARAGADAKPLVKAALTNIGTRMQKNIRQKAPHKTGALQRSILGEVKESVLTVSANVKYGPMLEYGTRRRIIEPRTAKALYWKGASHPVRSVRHPGIKPRKFFSGGVETSLPYALEQFEKVAERLVKITAGHR